MIASISAPRARAALDELHALSGERRIDPLDFAGIYAALGEDAAALEWLEKGYDEHSVSMLWVPEHFFFVRLREEPRFQALVERLGLPTVGPS